VLCKIREEVVLAEPYNKEYSSNKLEIELIKKDVNILSRLCEKYDVTIDKMQEVVSNLTKILTIQEQKLEVQEKTNKEFDSTLEKHVREQQQNTSQINDRITKVNSELTTKIEQVEVSILSEIQHLKNELVNINTNLNKKIGEIDMFRYMVMGGIALFVFILSNLLGIAKFFINK
jgi:chromosome segregation ATPase